MIGERRSELSVTPLGWTLAGLAGLLMVAGFNTGNNTLYMLLALVLALLTVDGLHGLAFRRAVALTLLRAGSARAGERGVIQLGLELRPARPAAALRVLRLTLTQRRASPAPAVESVEHHDVAAVWREDRETYQLAAGTLGRGLWQLSSVAVLSDWPFGLVRVRLVWHTSVERPILPPPARPLVLAALRGPSAADARRTWATARPLWADAFRSVREFRPGDSTRSIHWRSSARRGTLVVREFEEESSREALVVFVPAPVGADWRDTERGPHRFETTLARLYARLTHEPGERGLFVIDPGELGSGARAGRQPWRHLTGAAEIERYVASAEVGEAVDRGAVRLALADLAETFDLALTDLRLVDARGDLSEH